MKKRMLETCAGVALAAAVVALCSLGGCAVPTDAPTPQAPSGTTTGAPAAPSLPQLCVAATPLLAAGTASSNATVSGTAVYGSAFCNLINAGQTPATQNSNSQAWLNTVIQGTETAAQLAGVILPLLAL